VSETEDHVACLFEVMRYLIAGEDVAVANLTQQQAFFAAHVQPWMPALCDAVAQHPKAHFYAALAALTRAFAEVEAQGFDMLG
jgi:TorA maturation chaperone TorD